MTPQERDMVIRTVVGEAADQPDSGQAAVAHVILNRAKQGGFGNGITGVIQKPWAFEPWMTRRKELEGLDPNSRSYQRAARIVDQVASGDLPDETKGSTHFLQPEIVRARTGGHLPDWAKGDGIRIGDHVFYGAQQSVRDNPAQRAIGSAMANAPKPDQPQTMSTQALPFAGDSIFDRMEGETKPKAAPAAQGAEPSIFDRMEGGAQPKAKATETDEQFRTRNYGSPTAGPPKPFTPEDVKEAQQQKGHPGPLGEAVGVIKDLPRVVTEPAAALIPNIRQRAGEAWEAAKEGAHELARGNFGPTFKTVPGQPATTLTGAQVPTTGLQMEKPGAVLGLLGGLGIPLAPVSGLTKTIGEEATKWTGSPKVGESTENLLNAMLPGVKGAKAAKARVPLNRAVNTLVDTIGEPNLPDFIRRVEANPTLAPMDASQPVLGATQRIATKSEEAPLAVAGLRRTVDARRAAEKGAIREGITELGGGLPAIQSPLQALEAIKQKVKDVGAKQIEPALAKTGEVDVTGVVGNIDKELTRQAKAMRTQQESVKAAFSERGEVPPTMTVSGTPLQQRLSQLKNDLVSEDGRTQISDPRRLHEIQSELRAEAQGALNSADPAMRKYGHDLMKVRDSLVEAIDKASPKGAYAKSLEAYRDANHVQEWWERGQNFQRNSKDIERDSFDAWKRDWAKATKEEKMAAAAGTLGELQRQVRTMRSTGSIEGIAQIEETADKLRLMFKKGPADKFLQWLTDERSKSLTNQKLFDQSQTAFRQLGEGALKIRGVGEHGTGHVVRDATALGILGLLGEAAGPALGLAPGTGSLLATGATAARAGGAAVRSVGQRIGRRLDVKHNEHYARLASTPMGQQPELLRLLKQRAGMDTESLPSPHSLMRLMPQ